MTLEGKTVLVTGAARRIGRALALAVADAGADVIIHYSASEDAAEETRREAAALGVRAEILQADLEDPLQAAGLIARALSLGPLYALVNNAAIFEPFTWETTSLGDWQRNLAINLTAPFLLSQAFGKAALPDSPGRIVNLVDWRALRPGIDHLPYTVSKAALVALTQSLARSFAPHITVNAMALGAILPPSDGGYSEAILRPVPAGRWAMLEEVSQTLLFLLDGPSYITGEVIHVDGGRHLV